MGKETIVEIADTTGTVGTTSSILPLTVVGAGFGLENTGRMTTIFTLAGLVLGITVGGTLIYLGEETDLINILQDHLTTWGARAVEVVVPITSLTALGATLGCCVGNISTGAIQAIGGIEGAVVAGASSLLRGSFTIFGSKKSEPYYKPVGGKPVVHVDIDFDETPNFPEKREALTSKLTSLKDTLSTRIKNGNYNTSTNNSEALTKELIEMLDTIISKKQKDQMTTTQCTDVAINNIHRPYLLIVQDVVTKLQTRYTPYDPYDNEDQEGNNKIINTWIRDNIEQPFEKIIEYIKNNWDKGQDTFTQYVEHYDQLTLDLDTKGTGESQPLLGNRPKSDLL